MHEKSSIQYSVNIHGHCNWVCAIIYGITAMNTDNGVRTSGSNSVSTSH